MLELTSVYCKSSGNWLLISVFSSTPLGHGGSLREAAGKCVAVVLILNHIPRRYMTSKFNIQNLTRFGALSGKFEIVGPIGLRSI